MTTREANFIRNPAYLSVSLTHFFVDVLNNSRTLLVAILAVSIGLTNAQVGIALLLYNIGSALAQPLFGILADRFGPRWLVIGGLGWMIFLYGVAALAGDWVALAALTLAGIGSGAFHPTGTMVASQASQTARTRATAVFFTAGQMGLFIGPVLAGALLNLYQRPGFILLPLIALLPLLASYRYIHHPRTPAPPHPRIPIPHSPRPTPHAPRPPLRTTLPLAVVVAASSTIGIAAINFAPKLFTEQGYSPGYVGWIAGLFMMGSAIGGIVGGSLSDHYGRKPAILLGMFGAILPLYFYIPAGDPWRFGLLFLTGFFAGMPHSVLVIMAQSLLPGRHALASGLTLGLMFFSGAIGTYILGLIADEIGLTIALQGTIVLPLAAIVGTLALLERD